MTDEVETGKHVKTQTSNEVFKVVDIVPTAKGDFAVLVDSTGFARDTVLTSKLKVVNIRIVQYEQWIEV